jgi:hypothetical protein
VGSAHDDDPYADLPTPPTLWSRSVVRIERHPFGLWVFEVRYAPVQGDRTAVARLSDASGFPADLPVDVVPTLLRGPLTVPDEVDHQLRTVPAPFWLAAACALALGGPGFDLRLPEYASALIGTEHEPVAIQVLLAYRRFGALAALGRRSEAARTEVLAALGGGA